MQSFFKTAIITGIPFGLVMGIFFATFTHSSMLLTIFTTLFASILFGLSMAKISTLPQLQQPITPLLQPNEQILKVSPANHFVGLIAMGGWLFLTNQRLIFQAHRLMQQPYQLSTPITEITQIRSGITTLMHLAIRTRHHQNQRFVVGQRHAWSKAIQMQIAENAHENL